jgi:GWxTD domain-containing protein
MSAGTPRRRRPGQRSIVLLLACLLAPGFARGVPDGDPVGASGQIRFVVDAASFHRSSKDVYEEVYLLIPNADLRFVERGGSAPEAEIRVRFKFRTWPTGEPILQETLEAKLRKAMGDSGEELQVLQRAFAVPRGAYELRVEVEDRNTLGFGFFHLFGRSPKRGSAVCRFVARPFEEDGIEISDVELARSVARNAESEFAKGAIEVIPQPNRMFGALMPALSFYYEIYDLEEEQRDPAGEPYRVVVQVRDASGSVVHEDEHALIAAPEAMSFRRTGMLDITGLEAGAYDLRVQVESPSRGLRAETERRFRIVWKGEDVAGRAAARPRGSWAFAERTGVEVIDEMRALLGQGEIKRLEEMGPEERSAWIESYWKERDPSPETELNELREEHYRRIRVANTRFASLRMKGMETDRGRIYVRFGEPDEIRVGFADQSFISGSETIGGRDAQIGAGARIRGGFNVDEKEYEVWTYTERGDVLGDREKVSSGLGMRFVFVDVEGYGNFRLVESTELGEY